MWLPWSSPKDSNSSTKIQQSSIGELKTQQAEEDVRHLGGAWGELSQLSFGTYPLLGLGASVIFLAGWTAHRRWDSLYSRHFKRITRHYDVPDSYIREKRYMKGVVTGYVRLSPIPSLRPGCRRILSAECPTVMVSCSSIHLVRVGGGHSSFGGCPD